MSLRVGGREFLSHTHTQMNRVILKSYYWKVVVQPDQGQPQQVVHVLVQ